MSQPVQPIHLLHSCINHRLWLFLRRKSIGAFARQASIALKDEAGMSSHKTPCGKDDHTARKCQQDSWGVTENLQSFEGVEHGLVPQRLAVTRVSLAEFVDSVDTSDQDEGCS